VQLSDLNRLCRDLPKADLDAEAAARARDAQLTKPAGALGRLEDIACWLAAWQGRHPPQADRLHTVVFAANHGITAQGVSAFPAEVTHQMVANFEAGGAAVNQLCAATGSTLSVHAFDLEQPSGDFTEGPALSEQALVDAVTLGLGSVPAGTDLIAIGEMGIGNTTVAAALAHALFGGNAADWVGPGTGVDDAGLERKATAVSAGVARHKARLDDPWQVLRYLGGQDVAAMVGAIIGARQHRVPVLLDGYVCGAAAAILHSLDPGLLDHCLAAHRSAEPAHKAMLARLGKTPLLDFGMRLGEASGAALAMNIVRAAAATHTGMATFAEASVATKIEP